MKKIILLLLAVSAFGFSGFAQQLVAEQVPPQVLMAYKKQFPTAQQTRWGIMRDSTYAVCFVLGECRHFAKCDSEGNWLQHDSNIGYAALPEPVKSATKEQFPDFEVRYVSRFETVDTEITYKLALMKGKETRVVRFSPKGEILNNNGKHLSN